MVRFNALMPRRATEAIGRLLKGDQVLAKPDHVARAAYEARMTETVAQAEKAPSGEGTDSAAPAAPAGTAAKATPAETATKSVLAETERRETEVV